jgi:hypothetical protein
VNTYPKTENVFVRNPDTHKLTVGELREPAHAQVRDWLVTEKIDGTNIRILIRLKSDGGLMYEVRGRSDRASVPGDLTQNIRKLFGQNHAAIYGWATYLAQGDENIGICLYGEGYGPGIQKTGGLYRPKQAGKTVRIFDVTTTHLDPEEPNLFVADGPTWWRTWEDVKAAAKATGLETVPEFGRMTMAELTELTTAGFESAAAFEDGGEGCLAEGLVARTDPYMYDYRGHRIMFKIKTHDLGGQ